MTIKDMGPLLKSYIGRSGLKGIGCDDIMRFISILKAIEDIDHEIPGVIINVATSDDNLNDGESLIDLINGDVGHYCAKVSDGDRYIINDKLTEWAIVFLINDAGTPNYKNINKMREHGFYVGPGEADCFGWLSGVIRTKKGNIVFG